MSEEVASNNEEKMIMVTYRDYNVVSTIKEITSRGRNAEVKRRNDGSLVVYEVTKKISAG